ncbi:MAG: hypothetical protein ACQGTM_09930 [bacterium]
MGYRQPRIYRFSGVDNNTEFFSLKKISFTLEYRQDVIAVLTISKAVRVSNAVYSYQKSRGFTARQAWYYTFCSIQVYVPAIFFIFLAQITFPPTFLDYNADNKKQSQDE